MGLEKFPHPQQDMGIFMVSNYYYGDRSEESIPDGIYPLPFLLLATRGEETPRREIEPLA
jgi:hypothetical protein